MRKRAHTTGTAVPAPKTGRPLLKTVYKATGKIVRVVWKKPINKLGWKHGTDGKPAASPYLPGGWQENRQSGITIVVESECDAEAKTPKPDVTPSKPTLSQFSIATTPDMRFFVSPPEPHNSQVSESEEHESPQLDEQTAFELLNCLYYGHMQPNEPDAEEDDLEEEEDSPLVGSEIHHQPRGARMHRAHSHLAPRPTQKTIPSPPIPPTRTPTNVLHVVLLIPWCYLVGGLILLWPAALDRVVFQSGFLHDRVPASSADGGSASSAASTSSHPRGLRRFAYWATNASEHVFIFLALSTLPAYYYLTHTHPDAGTARALWLAAALSVSRFAWVWGSYIPREGLWERIGDDDRESLWLIWKGKAVVDAAFADHDPGECEPDSECMTRGVCSLRRPYDRQERE
ncbi:hypothetical protein PYCCODRAFT_1479518 [Trametes coccinea BRFM310]|uniref:Uncharacterized protein n=1 Tax=Trametes coccinea (strain BRFM310) TaxID=1353009 RepID=A0A1Y2IFJ5_TRAC3|nr:hypothetical protein PYCCODRAFT_1479518 [Trametes coccinea BRFM310]